MKILMVTSESVPFAKTGGLADAVPALSEALAQRGHDVRLVMPRYRGIGPGDLVKHPEPMAVSLGAEGEWWCAVFESHLGTNGTHGNPVPVYFLDREDLFDRPGIYGPDGGSSWPDNARRFAFLSSGAFALCRHLSWIPDIFHAHDWPAAPVSFLLAAHQREGEFGTSGSALTVHNLGYPGLFGAAESALLHRESEKITDIYGGIREGSLNFLALGLETADAITTVSPTYAREILTPSEGQGLDDILTRREDVLTGILNGMDYDEWNPSTDPALAPDFFDLGDMAGKERVKARLQQTAGLPVDPEVPLFGMIARLTGQKGLDLLVGPEGALDDVVEDGTLQVVVLGTGEGRYERALRERAKRYPRSLSASIAFDANYSRLIEGGSDFFLMPSLYEPCGLNQMYSLRYGTLPVVRRTGGLADTIVDIRKNRRKGTGFLFEEAAGRAFAQTIRDAADFYRKRRRDLLAARRRGMRIRFDWNRSAALYEKTLERALESGRHTRLMRRIGDY